MSNFKSRQSTHFLIASIIYKLEINLDLCVKILKYLIFLEFQYTTESVVLITKL